MENIKYYTANSKIQDAILLNYRISAQLGFFKMKLNFDASTTIEELCYDNNIHPDLFVLVSNLYVFDDYDAEGEDACIPIEVLFEFILKVHQYFNHRVVARARQKLVETLELAPVEKTNILMECFEQLMEKIVNLTVEVDRYIHSLLECGISLKINQIQMFLMQQEEIDKHLDTFLTMLTYHAPFFRDLRKYFRVTSYFLMFQKNIAYHHRLKSVVWKRIMKVHKKMERILAN